MNEAGIIKDDKMGHDVSDQTHRIVCLKGSEMVGSVALVFACCALAHWAFGP